MRRITKLVKLDNIWKSHELILKSKIPLMKSLGTVMAFYSCEAWLLRAKDISRIVAFEMWGPRRIFQISWPDIEEPINEL